MPAQEFIGPDSTESAPHVWGEVLMNAAACCQDTLLTRSCCWNAMLHRVIWGSNGCCRQACRQHRKKLLKELSWVLFQHPSKNNCPKSKHTEITNNLKRQTESICNTPALLGFGVFFPSSAVLGRRENIIFIRNPDRSNWNLRIHITPYDQEHLLSSQAQQGRGKNHHSRSEKWISSKCGAASTLVGTETEQN